MDGGRFWRRRSRGFSDGRGQFSFRNRAIFVYKGSIAVEGISLTIAALAEDHFEIAVIPKTWEMTNLSTLKPSDAINLEVDMIAKYVERLLAFRTDQIT